MASQIPVTAVAPAYDDFSGIDIGAFSNPYDALIAASNDDPKQLQARYDTHRTSRNAAQKEKLLAPDFAGVLVDPILLRLEDPSVEPGFVDTRHCLVFWARPPDKVKRLVAECQTRLKEVVPNLWLMPQTSLHMTALEITHSRTPAEIDALVAQMQASIPDITNHTLHRRARVIKPLLGFDATAIALSFVPAAGEALTAGKDGAGRDRSPADDAYTYHHLRRDLYEKASATGVAVGSRYVVPSAHLTIGRFIRAEDFHKKPASSSSSSSPSATDGSEMPVIDTEKMKAVVAKIEEVNRWLREEFWPKDEEEEGIGEGGEWVVGEGKGLDCRRGALWYGAGGETIRLGDGF